MLKEGCQQGCIGEQGGQLYVLCFAIVIMAIREMLQPGNSHSIVYRWDLSNII